MGYKALYRTYRPQTFDEVAGQKQIIQTLKNAIKENKIAHAYLFTGPRGTGKTTMAKLLAKALNCKGDNKPCDECESCLAISEGSYPDVIEIDAASNNGVDEVRNLIDKVKYAPIEGKYKVYIIDEVHMMSQGAFNALLKTLEEPPAHVVFVLATTEPHKVLPTILSRCQRFDFGRISRKDIEERLVDVLLCENVEYEDGVIELVSELCDGGMRDALSILDQTIAYAGDYITVQNVRDIYGIVSNSEKIEFVNLINSGNYETLISNINFYDEKGIDIYRLTNNLIDLLKEIIIYKNSNSFRGLKIVNDSNADELVSIPNTKLFDMIDILVDALSSYKKVGAPRALFEIACLKMCGLKNETERVVYKEVVVHENTPAVTQTDYQTKSIKLIAEADLDELNTNKIVPVEKLKNTQTEVETPDVIEMGQIVTGENEENVPVSHETNETAQEITETKPIATTINNMEDATPNEEELLNVLVQASRDALVKAQQQWVMLPKYLTTPATAKVTGILLDGRPMAACDNVIIIGYANDVYLNRVYEGNNYNEMNSLLKALYNSDVKCYCLTNDDFTDLKAKYISLRQLNKLPQAKPIIIQRKNITINESKNAEVDEGVEYAKKLFGDNVIIKEEN